ncbi:hypothetical protein WA538_000006, partial [Blastocystis sp. DL]
MFKKKNRSAVKRTIRKAEESSDEDALPSLGTLSHPPQTSQHTLESDPSHAPSKTPVYVSRARKLPSQNTGFFSSSKPKFTKKIDFSAEYDVSKTTDGLESMESPTAQPAEEKTVIVTEQPMEPPKNSPMTQPPDEFIRVPKTSSFRTSLRERNAMLSSESSDESEHNDSLPTYTASYEDEVATTGYATIPNQFKPSHPKPSSDEDYSIHRKDLNDAVTNPGPMWDEVELSASTSDEEARWEQSLVSRAMAGPIITSHVSQTVVAAGPSAEFSVVSQERVMNRLNAALNDLRVGYDEDARTVTATEREIEEIEADETTQFSDKRDMETRYDYYQRQLDYFRRLSGYLTDRKKEIEQLYAQYCTVRKQYKAQNDIVNRLYMNDDIRFLSDLGCFVANAGDNPFIPDLEQIHADVGAFVKPNDYYDAEVSQLRNQDRCTYVDSPEIVRESIREVDGHRVITADPAIYLNNVMYYQYADDATSKYLDLLQSLRTQIDNVFDSKSYTHMRFDRILSHFATWRQQFPDDYTNAYISMSVHEFLAPVIIPSLVHFDPLGLQEEAEESLAGDEPFGRIDERCFFHSLREMPWFQPLQQFCESSPVARDATVLPRLVQKTVVSFINDIILFDWNPLSVREAAALQRLLGELAGFFTTVTEELRAVYRSVATRISDCMNASVWCVCSLTSEKTGDVQVDAQEVVELYLTRGVRLLEVINMLASFMELGTPAPFIDCIVNRLCAMLGGMVSTPCLVPRCKVFARKINALIPDQVTSAKEMIQR